MSWMLKYSTRTAQGCMPGHECSDGLPAPLDVLGLHVAGGLYVFVYNDPSKKTHIQKITSFKN